MNILSTSYTLKYKSFDIYLAGCKGNPHCEGCQNPESWNFNQGTYYKEMLDNIKTKINDFGNMIENIMIFGGEPLDQPINQLTKFLIFLKQFNKNIWLFTRYEFKDISDIIKVYCDYIKCGRYIKDLKTDDNIQYGIKLATSNQKIYKRGVDY